MNFKSIFRGLNLRGNKIINAKFDNPVTEKDAVNKQFLESELLLDTEKALEINNPVYFPWVTNLKNKSLKTILDELFFPVKNPVYIDPKFINIKITPIDEYLYFGEKYLLINELPKTIKIDYEITASDRISGLTASVTVTKKDSTFVIIDGLSTSDSSGTVTITTNFSDIESIVLSKKFNPVSVIKKDNYGIDYIIPQYEQNLTITYDILKDLSIQNILEYPVLYRKITTESDYLTGLISDSSILNRPGFVKSKTIVANANDNFYVVLIPKLLLDNSSIFINHSGACLEIPKEILKPTTGVNEMSFDYYSESIPYYICTIDLGIYNTPKNVDISFRKLK